MHEAFGRFVFCRVPHDKQIDGATQIDLIFIHVRNVSILGCCNRYYDLCFSNWFSLLIFSFFFGL